MSNKLFKLFSICFLFLSTNLFSQTIDTKTNGEKFEPLWSKGVGAGRANEGLRAGWLDQLQTVKTNCGFEYVRFHGLFHDDMFPYFEKNDGKAVYNWQYIDELFDRMLDMGVKPFVELAFFPTGIARTDSKTQFWWKANISPDTSKFNKWHDLVKAFTQHITERYGEKEILTWYFEVWNEPNLSIGFFDGDKSAYFRLYKESALAVKSVNKNYKIGGPATSNFIADNRYEGERYDNKKSIFWNKDLINTKEWKSPWMEEFLAYCTKEKLPVDFVSTHPYPTDYAFDVETGRGKGAARYVNSTNDDLKWLKKTVANSNYPNAEIHLTEWSTSPSSRDHIHDVLPAAAFIIKANLDCIGLANSLMYWTFTDIFEEKGGGENIFHGGFGMINFQGIVKPSYHAYRMLHQLGDEKLSYTNNLFVSRNSQTQKITALAYNYPKEFESKVPESSDAGLYMKASSRELNFTLKNLEPNAFFELEILDNNDGNVMTAYKEMGSPHSPTRAETQFLKDKANQTLKITARANADGVLNIKRTLTPWECVLIREL
ncbi:Beta-xylosidase [Arcticibacter svalbardensis MN12-7]|uniref:Beta-xylosidase n=1 Tax=Arcticibacter svalbardensis MN12-7 TaxID=1150600 RepID=R9GRZ4_9SPHI|nr:beta-xylosidase [Arcticibacter svalbardensis]EOR94617.1 Beta-xylosidase [Arcticibacter svalbardensis MN12-7]